MNTDSNSNRSIGLILILGLILLNTGVGILSGKIGLGIIFTLEGILFICYSVSTAVPPRLMGVDSTRGRGRVADMGVVTDPAKTGRGLGV